MHMHVSGVLFLDPSEVRGGFSFEKFRERVASRLDRVPVFRQRLLPTPLGIDHPIWADDPDFDIDNHIHHVALKGKHATDAGFKTWVGEYLSQPLDFTKPVWEMTVVSGLKGGRFATVSKIHHVAVDGTSGTDLMAHLIDASANVEPDPISAFNPRRLPNKLELTTRGIASRLSDPFRGVRALGRTVGSATRVAYAITRSDGDKATMARPFDAPRTFFNTSLTPRRSVTFGTANLDDLRFTKSAFGVTLNDVFLTACTMGLRNYLADHGEFLTRPLVVSVPVSVHGKTREQGRNAVSNMFIRLPVHVEDPLEQLRLVNIDTSDAKVVHGALDADIMGDVTEITPPALITLGSRLYSTAGLADRLTPIHNLVISNVAGPPVPVYISGARLEAVYPFGPLVEGTGLNITALSNMGNMDVGVIACPDVAPDIDDLIAGIIDAIKVLRKAADDRVKA